jgi:hypothetical protein
VKESGEHTTEWNTLCTSCLDHYLFCICYIEVESESLYKKCQDALNNIFGVGE